MFAIREPDVRSIAPADANWPRPSTLLQLQKLTTPSKDATDRVARWLKKNGVKATPGVTDQWLNIKVPVAQANKLLNAEFTAYTNPDTGVTAVRTLAYSLPESMKPFIDFVYPATA